MNQPKPNESLRSEHANTQPHPAQEQHSWQRYLPQVFSDEANLQGRLPRQTVNGIYNSGQGSQLSELDSCTITRPATVPEQTLSATNFISQWQPHHIFWATPGPPTPDYDRVLALGRALKEQSQASRPHSSILGQIETRQTQVHHPENSLPAGQDTPSQCYPSQPPQHQPQPLDVQAWSAPYHMLPGQYPASWEQNASPSTQVLHQSHQQRPQDTGIEAPQPPVYASVDQLPTGQVQLVSLDQIVHQPPQYREVQVEAPQTPAHVSANPSWGFYGQGAVVLPSPYQPQQHHHDRSGRPQTPIQTPIWKPAIPAIEASYEDEVEPGRSATPSETIDDNNATPARLPKRGRPTIPDSEKKPRKRRKRGTGGPGGWSKGMKIGPRQAVHPGDEFNDLYAQATESFIDKGDNEKAMELVRQAITLNPEIYVAHALLAEIYFAMGEGEKAMAALFTGAHTIPTDPEVWFEAANTTLGRHKGKREVALQQANYCFAQVIRTSSAHERHVEARFRRAAVNRELNNYTKALKDLEVILEEMPRNSSVLRQIAEICIDLKDITRAKEVYEETLAYYREIGCEGEESFTWADALVYAQILALEKPSDVALSNAIKTLKQLSRWLLGREEEAYWDELNEDDREFDSEDDPRRALVPWYIPGRYELEAYGAGLPLEIRARLGILRLRQGQDTLDEAIAHFEWLEPESRDEDAGAYEYPDVFLEVAQALHEAKQYEQALRFFQALKDTNAYSHTDFWLRFAACSSSCDDKLRAIECYEEARSGDDKCMEARTQLSILYTDFGERKLAMARAREAIHAAEKLLLPTHGRRKYEPKELRFAREEAEAALKEASQLPGEHIGGESLGQGEQKSTTAEGIHNPDQPPQQFLDESSILRDEHGVPSHEIGAREPSPDDERSMVRRIAENVVRNRSSRLPARCDVQPPKYDYRVKRLSHKERDARKTDLINELYQDLLDNTDAMRENDDDAKHTWMKCAEVLLKDFRGNRTFYFHDSLKAVSGAAREELLMERKKWQEQAGTPQSEDEEPDPDTAIPSVESSLPTDHREISFDEWLDVFLEHALLLAQSAGSDSKKRCYATIDSALTCFIWKRDAKALLQIHITWLACALALKDQQTLYDVVLRWFMRTYAFNNDAYRLFAAIALVYPLEQDKNGKEGQLKHAGFRGRSMHQLIIKKLMQADASLPMDYNPEEFGPVPEFMRKEAWAEEQSTKDNEMKTVTPANDDVDEVQEAEDAPAEADPPTTVEEESQQEQQSKPPRPWHHDAIRVQADIEELNTLLLFLYGQLLTTSGKHTGAISYYLRAQSLDPHNPVILLSIALSYMHHLMTKHCEDRHMTLLQGWAFFEEYANARRDWAAKTEVSQTRMADDEGKDVLNVDGLEALIEREIEFNRARCWHMLGMADLAVRSYEKMLSFAAPPVLTQEVVSKHSDFTMDAAYAISTIYALSGNADMAKEVTEKYLVV